MDTIGGIFGESGNWPKKIGKEEKSDLFIVELGALLHDIADWKSNDGDLHVGGRATREWLESLEVGKDLVDKVVDYV